MTGAPAATATGEPRHTLPSAHDVMKIVLLDSDETLPDGDMPADGAGGTYDAPAEGAAGGVAVGVAVGVAASEPLGAGTPDSAGGPPDGAVTYDGAGGMSDTPADGAVGSVADGVPVAVAACEPLGAGTSDSAAGPPDGAATSDGAGGTYDAPADGIKIGVGVGVTVAVAASDPLGAGTTDSAGGPPDGSATNDAPADGAASGDGEVDIDVALHTLAVAVKSRPDSVTMLSEVSWTTTGVPQPPDHVVDVSPAPDRAVITVPDGEEPNMKGPAVPSKIETKSQLFSVVNAEKRTPTL